MVTLPRELQTARDIHWRKGEILFAPEEQADALYYLTAGSVRLYLIGAAGREITTAVHGAGQLIGIGALEEGTYGYYAEALEAVNALLITREHWQLIQENKILSEWLNQTLSLQLSEIGKRYTAQVFLEVSQRLAMILLTLAHKQEPWQNGPLALHGRISHQDLAHMVGSTRETTTKLLGDFRAQGLIDLGYRRLVLLDREGLLRATEIPLSTE